MTAADLYTRIISNHFQGVKRLLNKGVDPNISFQNITIIPLLDHNITANITPGTRFIRNRDKSFHVTPLHAAILNCYFNCDLATNEGNQALSIVLELLQRGANKEIICPGGITVANLAGKINLWKTVDSKQTTPLKFIEFLGQAENIDFSISGRYNKQDEILKQVAKSFKTKSSAKASQIIGHRKPPTGRVLQSVINTYDKLLFSENLSDIKFICSDNVVLPAHRCILAAASPYFETAFQGPWQENNASGEWKTAHPSAIMRAVLSLIYRGDSESVLLDLDPLHLLSVASEFQLESLLLVAEDACVRRLDHANVKDFLKAAHLYGNAVLKNACFQFIRLNAAALLLDLKITSLATEYPSLWAEMGQAISPRAQHKENEGNKRARLR